MQLLIVIAVVGLLAQLVDGSLGMGYGVTSSTLLLSVGLTPVASSTAIHVAKVGTALASAVAHWRLGNVHWATTSRIAVPGAVGAFLGALSLTSLPVHVAAPVVAAFLFGLGVVVLVRFSRPRRTSQTPSTTSSRWPLLPLGLVAGFCDAIGGGGWGPISTSSLLAAGRMSPRSVVGSVNTSEFLVSVAATAGFILALGADSIQVPVVAALLGGGVVAAPLAAWLVRRMPAHLLGVLIGGTILLTNVTTLSAAFALPGAVVVAIVVVVVVAVTVALRTAQRLHRLGRDVEPATG